MLVSSVYVDDPDFTLYVGDVREVLATLPDESVHCVVTSPPYWGLRDYGTGSWEGGDEGCDHKQGRDGSGRADGVVDDRGQRNRDGAAALTRTECKCGARRVDRQLGLEATPDEYVANMVDVFREVRRVLRRDGTCWVNLGDSYASGGTGWRPGNPDKNGGNSNRDGVSVPPGLKPKDLVGVPWRVAFALQADGWYLRSDIIWSKPNPMPESVTDRPTKSHEYVFLLTRSPRYFFDQEAVREPTSPLSDFGNSRPDTAYASTTGDGVNDRRIHARLGNGSVGNPAGRNVRSVWEIATQPYPEAHFATFPEELARRCIAAGTSERGVCPECGAPWEREVASQTLERADLPNDDPRHRPRRYDDGKNGEGVYAGTGQRYRATTTTGWRPSCDHTLEPVPATVLDPFMGSGTTAHIARKHGRRSIGIELNPAYAELCARRLQQLSLLA